MSTPADTFTDRTGATDEEFRARVAAFDAAEAAPESFDAVAAVRRVEALAQSWEANNRQALRSGLTPSGRASAQTALDAAEQILAALRDDHPSPDPATVTHNHTRFRNDAGPWSPCPVSCPAAGLLR